MYVPIVVVLPERMIPMCMRDKYLPYFGWADVWLLQLDLAGFPTIEEPHVALYSQGHTTNTTEYKSCNDYNQLKW
jgi:hypothetical protein